MEWFILELAGHYWKNITYYLKNKGISFYLVNPYHVNKTKELENNSSTKNDKKDSRVRARIIYQVQYITCMFDDELYINLRIASNKMKHLRKYEHLTKRNDDRLTGKQAIIALSVRLAKAIYALCTKKQLY